VHVLFTGHARMYYYVGLSGTYVVLFVAGVSTVNNVV